jgi:sterol desaturase/sphingolipid hydroxylase (fatty acid hydroxylase superfamily)
MNWSLYFKDVSIIGSRYLIIAGIAFLIWYVVLRKMMKSKKIQAKYPQLKDYTREIGFSITTIFILAVIPTMILGSPELAKHTKFYTDINQHSIAWFIIAFPVMAMMHDTYFYWMHRLIHHPKLFKWVHLIHHKSTNPSPFAAYAFHPFEAVLESLIFLIFVFTIPVHLYHLLFFFLFMILYNVYGPQGIQ